MYIFNPEHDLCLANGDPHFVPPESALAFGRDCADLTRWMEGLDSAADDDASGVPHKIVPWGWNYVLRKRLRREGYPEKLLPGDEQIETIAKLSDRRFALDALEYIHTRCSPEADAPMTHPDYRTAATSVGEVKEFVAKHRNVVLKAPVSGSGKGIRWVADTLSHSDEGWYRNLILKHGCVIVEQRLTPLVEFAMLYRVTADDVVFCGYSLFYTENGAYRGNILASDGFIERRLSEMIPLCQLHEVCEGLRQFLKERACGRYEGFVGVDQFFSQEQGFNPVVEINMRMTMGLLARNIYDRFREELSLGDGTHHFEIVRERGPAGGKYSYRIVI
ncbi:MAG: hypothetical protein J6U80_01525 [Bacteroidales bacterium]|nr:hypothetical protein [Bacteroidales bacterium]